ncbi:unnamed protein product [Miscanthus lutarioriparius]|uniref:No apical meristem-associated C-terminal domain-containing protein n=1 Tax=Miscanthus lutarioriparius TaxID=422564 RepID=A0A811SEG5_9POAL|nr:unnamed protein product [Miscanthus lutarioriparius]
MCHLCRDDGQRHGDEDDAGGEKAMKGVATGTSLGLLRAKGFFSMSSPRNQIEVWDIDARKLCYPHLIQKAITAFSVLQKSLYIYVGDSSESVSLMKLSLVQRCLPDMVYSALLLLILMRDFEEDCSVEMDLTMAGVSAWLTHSNDPINGKCKKNESYWGDVHELYNSTTPTNRRRDDQIRDMAKQFYLDDYPKEGTFTVLHCWKVLRDEPKWHVVLEELEKPNKRSLDGEDEAIDISGTPKGVGEKERPVGTKQAKKQRAMEYFLEAQERNSDRKVETVRLRREAALLE